MRSETISKKKEVFVFCEHTKDKRQKKQNKTPQEKK